MSRSNYHGGPKRDHCYFCGAFGGIEEHHIIPQRFGGPDNEANTVGLCSTCHDKIERLYDASFYEHFGIEDESGQRAFHRACAQHGCKQTVEVRFKLRAGPITGYCTGCAMQKAGRLCRDRRTAVNGSTPIEVVRERAVEIADSSPLKEAA